MGDNAVQVEADGTEFKISYRQGNCGITVVAFTGIGHGLGAIQTEEFRKSLSLASGTDTAPSIIHVIDKQRRWYNDGILHATLPILQNLLDRLQTTETLTLGNSMGGFGAIIFAKRLKNCSRVLAFCPQSSVHSEIAPFETRWPQWRNEIAQWDVPDATLELAPHIRYDLYYGVKDRFDAQHIKRFQALGAGNLNLHLIPDCGHEVAADLKKLGKLEGIISAFLWQPEEGNVLF